MEYLIPGRRLAKFHIIVNNYNTFHGYLVVNLPSFRFRQNGRQVSTDIIALFKINRYTQYSPEAYCREGGVITGWSTFQ